MNDSNTLLSHIKLHFHINHPSLEECYAYGYESANSGQSEDVNPYKPNTVEYDHWAEGWWAGFYGEQPLHVYDLSYEEDFLAEQTAANDWFYDHRNSGFLTRVLEITGLIVVSAFIGYQLIEMVA